MTTIIGSSERGAVRVLDVTVEGDVSVTLHIHHPNGRSGASSRVDLRELRGALAAPHATTINRNGARPVFVERRGSATYLWIQGVGQNGWSILVNGDELDRTVGTNERQQTPGGEESRSPSFWPFALLVALAAAILAFLGFRSVVRTASRPPRSLQLP